MACSSAASRRLKAALLNPLPPLGLAPELRAEVLTAGGPERLRLVRRGWKWTEMKVVDETQVE